MRVIHLYTLYVFINVSFEVMYLQFITMYIIIIIIFGLISMYDIFSSSPQNDSA